MCKKKVCILLALLQLILLFSGCTGEPEPLRICVDLESVFGVYGVIGSANIKNAMYDLESSLKSTAEIADYVIEYIPGYGPERENALDRIRTEVMSGRGPDVFLTHCMGGESSDVLGEALFQIPEKAMELGLFLPLDEYIDNAEYAEWNKFTQVVMDAGKYKGEQQIVPLTYSVHTAAYLAKDLSYTPTHMTWEEMLNSEKLYDTAARLGDAETMIRSYDSPIDYILGNLADYKEEKLAFTEEELYQRVTEICELTAYTRETKPYYIEGWSEGSIGYLFIAPERRIDECVNGINQNDEITLVPLYSDDGGCTAIILTFAAVNRNTMRPKDAFTVIDCLMATGKQKHSPIFIEYIYRGMYNASMPMHDELMSKINPTDKFVDLSDENFAKLSEVREIITNVHFAGALNVELEQMMRDSVKAYSNGKDYRDIVHEAYSTMKQIMAE